MISKLHIKNFIAFTDLKIDFLPGINIAIGEINVQALRQLQISHSSMDKLFKQVLDGFEVDLGHKALLAGDGE